MNFQLDKNIDLADDEWICPLCSISFNSQHTFTVHIRQHNQTDHNHICSICFKQLSSSNSLDRHMLIHSGERPFKCKICNMSFTTNGNMNRHARKVHNLKSTNTNSDEVASTKKKRKHEEDHQDQLANLNDLDINQSANFNELDINQSANLNDLDVNQSVNSNNQSSNKFFEISNDKNLNLLDFLNQNFTSNLLNINQLGNQFDDSVCKDLNQKNVFSDSFQSFDSVNYLSDKSVVTKVGNDDLKILKKRNLISKKNKIKTMDSSNNEEDSSKENHSSTLSNISYDLNLSSSFDELLLNNSPHQLFIDEMQNNQPKVPSSLINANVILVDPMIKSDYCLIENQIPEQKFACKICNLEIKTVNTLQRHKNIHKSGGQLFSCNHCTYHTLDKSSLQRHLRTHNGERPYQCTICNYTFTTKANCERHVRKKHKKHENFSFDQKGNLKTKDFDLNEVNLNGSSGLLYQSNDILETTNYQLKNVGSSKNKKSTGCVQMNNSSSKGLFIIHQFYEPSNDETVCKYCNVDFHFKASLKQHLRTMCNNKFHLKPFVCSQCNQGYTTKNKCISHIKKFHEHIEASQIESVVVKNREDTQNELIDEIALDGMKRSNSMFNLNLLDSLNCNENNCSITNGNLLNHSQINNQFLNKSLNFNSNLNNDDLTNPFEPSVLDLSMKKSDSKMMNNDLSNNSSYMGNDNNQIESIKQLLNLYLLIFNSNLASKNNNLPF